MSTDRPADGGFFASLFDFSFRSFITTRIIQVLYVLAIIAAGFWAVALLVAGLSQGGATAFFALVGAIIGFFLAIIYIRVLLELVIVIFRIGEHTESMAQSLAGGGPQRWQAPEPTIPPQPYQTTPPAPPPDVPPQPGWEPPPTPTAEAAEPTRPLPDEGQAGPRSEEEQTRPLPDEEQGRRGDVPPPPA